MPQTILTHGGSNQMHRRRNNIGHSTSFEMRERLIPPSNSCSKLGEENFVSQQVSGVGDSSVVEPAPLDTQVLRGCGFESH